MTTISAIPRTGAFPRASLGRAAAARADPDRRARLVAGAAGERRAPRRPVRRRRRRCARRRGRSIRPGRRSPARARRPTRETRAVEAADLALKGVRAEYAFGLRTTLDILVADESLRAAQLALARERSDALIAATALLRATGRLDHESF